MLQSRPYPLILKSESIKLLRRFIMFFPIFCVFWRKIHFRPWIFEERIYGKFVQFRKESRVLKTERTYLGAAESVQMGECPALVGNVARQRAYVGSLGAMHFHQGVFSPEIQEFDAEDSYPSSGKLRRFSRARDVARPFSVNMQRAEKRRHLVDFADEFFQCGFDLGFRGDSSTGLDDIAGRVQGVGFLSEFYHGRVAFVEIRDVGDETRQPSGEDNEQAVRERIQRPRVADFSSPQSVLHRRKRGETRLSMLFSKQDYSRFAFRLIVRFHSVSAPFHGIDRKIRKRATEKIPTAPFPVTRQNPRQIPSWRSARLPASPAGSTSRPCRSPLSFPYRLRTSTWGIS